MKRVVILLTIFFSLCCCCSWEGIIKSIHDVPTTEKTVSADEFLSTMFIKPTTSPTEIKDFQGVQSDSLYKNYYLRYNADKEFALNLVASMPSSPSRQLTSDTTCRKSFEFISSAKFLASDFNKLGDLEFWQPNRIKEKEYYTCLKVPFSHTMLFDKESNIVYHVVEEIIDY